MQVGQIGRTANNLEMLIFTPKIGFLVIFSNSESIFALIERSNEQNENDCYREYQPHFLMLKKISLT